MKKMFVAAAMLAPLALGGCGGSDLPEVNDFSVTKSGAKVRKGPDFCALIKEGQAGELSILVNNDGSGRQLAFKSEDIARPGEGQEVPMTLLFAGIDGSPQDFTPEKARYVQDGLTRFITMEATDEMMFFLANTRDVAFAFRGKVIGSFPQKTRYKDDLAELARCAGISLDTLVGVPMGTEPPKAQ